MGEPVWESLGRGKGFAPHLCVRLNGEMALSRASLANFVQEKHLSMILVEKDCRATAVNLFSSIRKHSQLGQGFGFVCK